MKVSIVYFSGSGNTEYIAKKLKDKLEKINLNVLSLDINSETNLKEDTDLLIIGGPIYAGNVPEKLIRWVIKNVPETKKNTKAIVYSTSAGLMNANGVHSLGAKLSKKGYDILSKETYVMPRNFYFGRYNENTEEEIKTMVKNVENQIEELVIDINNNALKEIEVKTKGILGKDLLAETFSIMAKFMGKNFSVDDDCIRCGLCVRQCPQNNIVLNENGIIFKRNCMMCTKCIHNCPKNAILYKKEKYKQYRLNNYL